MSRPTPWRKWLRQAAIALPLVTFVLGALQWVRGRGLMYSIEYGILWAAICVAIFYLSRWYHFKRGHYCAMCDDD